MRLYPKNFKTIAWAILRVALALYLLILFVLFFFQEKLIFFPEKLPADYTFRFSGSFTERWITFEGQRMNSLVFKGKKGSSLILYFHGNAGSLAEWGEAAEELAKKTGFDVWIMDFPGYGKSEGSISSENQLLQFAEVFWEEAIRVYKEKDIILFGRSVGTGLAVQLAAKHEPAKLILESPYMSLASLANQRFPLVPQFLLKYQFHSDDSILLVNCPIFIVHGTEDEIIPFSQGRRISLLNGKSLFVPIEGAHHNDLGNFSEYWKALSDWLAQK